ncbi:MAG: serine/threonine-protein kinase [Myxococcales bacterium]|nr:serine/threonine protein kinase [Polyangiaceae bacterium]MDW8247857.1 serine/threonine-protein kinase [Myxococcales bacterium]
MSSESSVTRRQKVGRYEILAEIASGGMATVYLGRLVTAPGFERQVAIKKLHPHLERQKDFVEMFLDEARIVARLHHPNVVQTLECGADEGGHFLVMDYVEGPTLAKMLAKAAGMGERIPTSVAVRVALDALAGLHAAHELTGEDGRLLNVVHRDVSPQNILVSVDGIARITDFGVARANERLAVTRTGQLKGKLSYMAPEQARGEPTDRRADVFAMGVILWEMLTGRRLFRGKADSEAETLTKVLYGEIARVSAVHPEIHPLLDAICAQALERPLDARYATCADFAEALEQAARGGVEVATHREVARYVEQMHGEEIAQRRAVIRNLRSPGSISPDEPTAAETPPQLSSVSSAALSYEASPGSKVGFTPLLPAKPTAAFRGNGVLLVALGAALVVTVAAVGVLVWVVMRPPPVAVVVPAASAATGGGNPPSPMPVSPSSSLPLASTPLPTIGTSSAPAIPSTSLVPAPRVTPPIFKKVPVGDDGLSSNPYRR